MPPTRAQAITRAKEARAAGRHADAAAAWAQAIAASPDEPVLYHNLAAALGDLRRHAEAAETIEAGFARGLNAPQSYLVLARARAGMLHLGEAEAAYRRYLAAVPDDVAAHTEFAETVWMQSGDVARALCVLDDAIRALPGNAGLAVARLRLAGEMGDRRAELAGFETLLERFGPRPDILEAASAAALACGAVDEAVRHAVRLSASMPADPAALSALAAARLAAGEYPAAQEVVDRLRAIDPGNQYFIALQCDLWRLTGDTRREAWYDYDRLVFRAPLDAPPGWRSTETYVDDLTEALDARHCYRAEPFFQSVRKGSQISSITSFDDPSMKAYGAAVARPAAEFARRLAAGPAPVPGGPGNGARLHSAWSVLLPPGGHHASHVHPEGWISSACHLRFDGPDAGNAGWLAFGGSDLRTPVRLEAEHLIRPERGYAVFFPSYVWHGTIPFAENRTRLTVAADFSPVA